MTDSKFLSFRLALGEREICLFEEISPRSLVEMTALMRLSVICSLFQIKNWVVSQKDARTQKKFSIFFASWRDIKKGKPVSRVLFY